MILLILSLLNFDNELFIDASLATAVVLSAKSSAFNKSRSVKVPLTVLNPLILLISSALRTNSPLISLVKQLIKLLMLMVM